MSQGANYSFNELNPQVQLTVEREANDRLPFLDTVLHKIDNRICYSVYRKACHKDDYIHYYSSHNRKIKESVVVGFYLRALWISSPQFLKAEVQHITQVFEKLRYPRGLLIRLHRRAVEIRARPPLTQAQLDERKETPSLSLPNSPLVDAI